MMWLWALAVWVVNQPVANVYSEPSAEAGVATQVLYGLPVKEVTRKEDWLEIRTEEDYPGWIPVTALRKVEKPYAREGRTVRIDALAAHLYREADIMKRAPVLTVPYETALEVTAEPEDEERRWIEVRLVDGSHITGVWTRWSMPPTWCSGVKLICRPFTAT